MSYYNGKRPKVEAKDEDVWISNFEAARGAAASGGDYVLHTVTGCYNL